jgi:hypothetical protein
VPDVTDDDSNIDRPVTITAVRNDISEEDTLDEPHDLSDDYVTAVLISKRHVLFVLNSLSEGLNFGRACLFLTKINEPFSRPLLKSNARLSCI